MQSYCSRKPTRRYATSFTSFIVQEATRASPRISSFPEEHWKSGYDNARRTLAEPEVMRLPDPIEGVRIFDVCKDDSEWGRWTAMTVIRAASTGGRAALIRNMLPM